MHFKNYFFLVLCFIKLESASSQEFPLSVRQVRTAKEYLSSELSPDVISAADNIRTEFIRVIRALSSTLQSSDDRDSANIITDFLCDFQQGANEFEGVSFNNTHSFKTINRSPRTGKDLLALFCSFSDYNDDKFNEALENALEVSGETTEITNKFAWLLDVKNYSRNAILSMLPEYAVTLHGIFENSLLKQRELQAYLFGEAGDSVDSLMAAYIQNPKERSLSTHAGKYYTIIHVFDDFFKKIDIKFRYTIKKNDLRRTNTYNGPRKSDTK